MGRTQHKFGERKKRKPVDTEKPYKRRKFNFAAHVYKSLERWAPYMRMGGWQQVQEDTAAKFRQRRKDRRPDTFCEVYRALKGRNRR